MCFKMFHFKPGILPMGTWRVLSEGFVPRTTTSVTNPEKFTSRNEQLRVAVIIALLIRGTKQEVLKIAKSSYKGLPIL